MAGRSFGGFSYQERLGTGVFGELYRAVSGAGQEARIVEVTAQLAARPAFVRALVKFGEHMVPLNHPGAVGVRQVGRSGEQMVVVTDPVLAPIALAELAAHSGGRLPVDLALAIGLGAVKGLAHAHSLHIVHGAVHPRSVLIDVQGVVKLADFGLAWALVEAAAEADEPGVLAGLRGYLAPELVLQQSATEPSDVYAAGALLFELLHGEPPPGEMKGPLHVGRIIARALTTDPGARLGNAGQLDELLDQAIAADGCRVATPGELVRFVAERLAARDQALHAATDELVAELMAAPVQIPDGQAAAPRPPITELLAALEELPDPAFVARSAPILARRAGAALQEGMQSTPLPMPAPHPTGSVARPVGELEAEDQALRRPRVSPGRIRAAGSTGVEPLPAPRRSRALFWIAATVFALGGLAAILYTQTDLFDPGRKQAEERAAERERQDALARHEASQPQAAEVTITAAEPDAAVWLLLGRTPVDSLPLSAGMVHELRVEHEGYSPLDIRVTGYQWKEKAGRLHAEVEAALVPGRPKAAVPAFPAAGGGAPPAGPRGRGVVHVQSSPAGAQVWLLIGSTPRATITGLEAGKAYELKVLKDGFRPGFAAVRAEEWYLAGPAGPMVTSMSREVTLARRESGRSGKARKQDRKSRASRHGR